MRKIDAVAFTMHTKKTFDATIKTFGTQTEKSKTQRVSTDTDDIEACRTKLAVSK